MAKNRFPMGGMGGAPNMNQMIKQAQKMQQDILKLQEELDVTEVNATVGGGMVTVTATAKKEITSVKINPECVDPEDVEMLEDLILSAVQEALKKAEEVSAQQMSKITGGMNIPGLF
ncbi:MAG: YbaB/EbfC family nucleoid-associated protein [Clostridia bacterium]|nr:YbaB/EbfC family nucleoid-associated protein [Clostridia bacterium]